MVVFYLSGDKFPSIQLKKSIFNVCDPLFGVTFYLSGDKFPSIQVKKSIFNV